MNPWIEPIIEKGIPIPASKFAGRPASRIRALLQRMQAGDSYVTRSLGSTYFEARQIRVKIVTRKLPAGVWRVWRSA